MPNPAAQICPARACVGGNTAEQFSQPAMFWICEIVAVPWPLTFTGMIAAEFCPVLSTAVISSWCAPGVIHICASMELLKVKNTEFPSTYTRISKMAFFGCAFATTWAGEPTVTVPLPDGDDTMSGNAPHAELGGAGAAGAGSGLLDGVHVTCTGAHATDGPGAGEGVGVGDGVGEVVGGALVGAVGCDGCDGVVVVCDIWCALPHAASSATRDKETTGKKTLAGFIGLMTKQMNRSCARWPIQPE